MTPEQKAHAALQREMGGRWHYQRHEDKYSSDVPDISFAYLGQHGWIELKAAKDNEAIKLRPGQLNWMLKRGGNAFLIIRQLDDKGRHRQWVGVDNPRLGRLRHLRRPTPDTLVASIPCMTDTSFERVLRGLLEMANVVKATDAREGLGDLI